MGEGFGPLIQMYPYSVQADLISMKTEPIHYVCSDGAQAATPPLQRYFGVLSFTALRAAFHRGLGPVLINSKNTKNFIEKLNLLWL